MRDTVALSRDGGREKVVGWQFDSLLPSCEVLKDVVDFFTACVFLWKKGGLTLPFWGRQVMSRYLKGEHVRRSTLLR